MTDETRDQAADVTAAPEQPVDAADLVTDVGADPEAVADIEVQGNHALIVAQFADMDAAKDAYVALQGAEAQRAIDIRGVVVVNADHEGRIHVQKMTDHKTRNGFVWGAIGGAVIGLIFPPAILASALTVGVTGAALGKMGHSMTKAAVEADLSGVIAPGTSGIVALVEIGAVDAAMAEIPNARVAKSAPVDDATAAAVTEAAKAAGDSAAG
jgi:uncharacterized membrane protein